MIEVTKWPVLIVANSRTGSTELAFQIAKYYNVKHCFTDPDKNPDEFPSLINMCQTAQPDFVTKFMVSSVGCVPILDNLLHSDCFKIRLYRENELDQVVSFYIAHTTRQWNQTEKDIEEYTVPISVTGIKNSIMHIRKNNKKLNNLNVKFDVTTTYEKLNFGPTIDTYKTTPPKNLDEITVIAKKLL